MTRGEREVDAASLTTHDDQGTCTNCGAHVTADYVRVRAPMPDADTVPCCPHCPDKVWDGATVRDARAHRRSGAVTEYDAVEAGLSKGGAD